ncbi:MAG TPA: hypothetical protein PK995_07385 [Bacteroidia bacterium]|nr:hypothetical protein [Bacteroidia bacterium]
MKKIFSLIFFFLGIILIFIFNTHCNKSKLKAPVPFYLNIPSVSVYTVSGQGTTNHKITEIWIYENGQFKGVYPIGRNIPITSQPARIKMFAGIRKDGLSALRIIYPFYAPIEIDTTANENQILYRSLSFNYKSGINFKWMEDFENFGGIGGITIVKGTGSDTNLIILDKSVNPSADVFEGNKCMKIVTDANRPYAYLVSANTYTLSYDATYLELNYKCNQSFEIGLYSGVLVKSVITLVSTNGEWNKIYLDLTPYLSLMGGTSTNNNIGIYFKVTKESSVSQAEILMDNIKLISY